MKHQTIHLPAIVRAASFEDLSASQKDYNDHAKDRGGLFAEFVLLKSKEGDFAAHFHPAGSAPSFNDSLALILAGRYFFPTSAPLLEVLKKDFDEKFHAELEQSVKSVVADKASKGALSLKAPAAELSDAKPVSRARMR